MPDYHGAEAYSALLVAADALQRATSLNPDQVREALSRTKLSTPFGPVEFKSYGKFERQNSHATMVLQVVDNDFSCVWPKEHSTAEFKAPVYWRK